MDDVTLVWINDAAEEIGCSRATLWKYIRERGIPTFRTMTDRRTYIARTSLEELKRPIPHDPGNEGKAAA